MLGNDEMTTKTGLERVTYMVLMYHPERAGKPRWITDNADEDKPQCFDTLDEVDECRKRAAKFYPGYESKVYLYDRITGERRRIE